MQPNQNITPGPRMPLSPTSQPSGDLLEKWWVDIPVALRRYSLYLSETCSDGIYLTAWPPVAIVAPFLMLLVGLAEGATHWTFTSGDLILGNEPVIAFTQLLPFMVLVAAVGALSADLGFLLVIGYAVGDLLIGGPQNAASLPSMSLPIIYPVVPQLVSYMLLLLLAVTPTLSARYLLVRLDSLVKGTEPVSTILKACALAVVQGAIVYSWTLAAPLLIRVFWGWSDSSPPLSAAYYLQEMGGWVVGAAVIAAAVRAWLEYQAQRVPLVVQRMARLASGIRTADARLAFSRRLPGAVRALLTAFTLTLLISGFLGSLTEGVFMFLFLAVILVARLALLPNFNLWTNWVALITRLPLLARLAIGAFVVYFASQTIITPFFDGQLTVPSWLIGSSLSSGTFFPVLLSTCISLIVMTILIPPATKPGSPTGAVPSRLRPPIPPPVPPAQPTMRPY